MALPSEIRIPAAAYADDTHLVAQSRAETQELLTATCHFMALHGMTLNAKKSFSVTNRKFATAHALAEHSSPPPARPS